MRLLILVCGRFLFAIAVPIFDKTANFSGILVPADVAPGTIIYRLRASDSDFQYPLIFTLQEKISVISVDTLNCSRLNSVCQANVVLQKQLEIGRFYDFVVTVNNSRGSSARLQCSFQATNATTPLGEIFPGAPSLLTISESARRNRELGTITARGKAGTPRPVLLELWGSPIFGLRQHLINERDAQGTIVLSKSPDYEANTMHHLIVLANDAWTETGKDSRNILAWPLLVSVLDEQDTPPIFTAAPPTTLLDPSLRPGDLILRVHAEDGDRGNPREIRYGLVSENSPFTDFFQLSEETGELSLKQPLSEIQAISHSNSPILLNVIAEEVRTNDKESEAQSSTVQIALILPTVTGSKPFFKQEQFMTAVDENSAPGVVLNITNAEVIITAGDLFVLELINNNGTFDVTPGVVEKSSRFMVKVRDASLLDYEQRHSVECFLILKKLHSSNRTATARLVVYINDLNDNAPMFQNPEWRSEIQEKAEIGTSVVQIQAHDPDTNEGGRLRFTRLYGDGSEAFSLDPQTGLITVVDPNKIDCEQTPIIQITAEAADENGKGLTATAPVTIYVIDINDETPEFEKKSYEFIIDGRKNQFTSPAFIKAIDRDVTSPNNEIHYELIDPMAGLKLSQSGELSLIAPWTTTDVVLLRARAWDGGVPRLWSECEIRIYPPGSKIRTMTFIVSGRDPDRAVVEEQLRTLTGGQVQILKVYPFVPGQAISATDVSGGSDRERSVVVARVNYETDTVIDVNRIQGILDTNPQKTQEAGGLWWILILLLLLIIAAIIILILCCICPWCPLFMPPRKRKITETDTVIAVTRGSGHGHLSKGVQVAEWFGRKEAWTPEAAIIDVDSLRRHETERDSDRLHEHTKQHREQFYIREGNTDILRLITRDGDNPRSNGLMREHPVVKENGKDILMKRFIDQQQTEYRKTSVALPNETHYDHHLIEASLSQQNALLRQILLEREREMRLETQSLPAGTQTDRNVSTQTEFRYLRPPRRRTRSDNDMSDGSDEEVVVPRMERKRRRRKVSSVKRKINTPIQEESENNIENVEKQEKSSSTRASATITQTRTSILREMLAADKAKPRSQSAILKEVLQEISDSLIPSDSASDTDISSDNSTRKLSHQNHRFYSESDLGVKALQKAEKQRSLSELNLAKTKPKPKPKSKSSIKSSRYMDWYSQHKNKNDRKKSTSTDQTVSSATTVANNKKEARSVEAKPDKKNVGPEHPLLQHSARRYEPTSSYPRRFDDDADSGIAVTRRPRIAEKKSVFSIAYDDMQTRKLQPDTTSPPY